MKERNQDILAQLPDTLPLEEVRRVNWQGLSSVIHDTRTYEWRGIQFEVPPGVFVPGPTAQLIHDRIADGRIRVKGKRYAAMGVGLGVEAVAAGLMQASEIYGIDVHAPSVEASKRNYEIHVGYRLAPFVGVVSDLWTNIEHGHRFDVITFNPPFINYQLSEDKEISRNLCQGLTLADSFLRQTSDREALASDGFMYIILSNTAPLKDFVRLVFHYGFDVRVIHEQGWPDEEVKTFIFEIKHTSQA